MPPGKRENRIPQLGDPESFEENPGDPLGGSFSPEW